MKYAPYGLGAPAAAPLNGPHAEIRQGSPSSGDVVLWQTIIGVTPDGQFGPATAAATKAWQSAHGLSADGIVGPNTWAAAMGSSTPVAVVSTPAASPIASASAVALSAAAAAAALALDPNYCTSVRTNGTPVNVAVHNFKTAWNAANPGNPVPINTGNYEQSVANALSSVLGGQSVPPGCGTAAAPVPAPTAPVVVTPVQPAPVAANIPSAVMMLASMDPCDPSNAAFVCQIQAVLGITQDGKYGADTAAAARRLLPSAPAGCSPRPSWWTPTGQSNCPGAARPAPTPATAPPVATAPQMPAPATTPAPAPSAPATSAPVLTAPTTVSKISTGALVAGAIGVVGLVGVVALAVSGKKSSGVAHHTSSHGHKPTRRKPSKSKKKPKHHRK